MITFSTQEMLLFRNAATREVMVGAENRVEQCTYAAVLTRVDSELDNEITGGWKVVEVSQSHGRSDSPSNANLKIFRWHGDQRGHIYSRFPE